MALGNWPLYRAVGYLGGRGVSFGTPLLPVAELAPNAYSVVVDIIQNGRTAACDKTLDLIADNSLDHFYMSPRLANVEEQEKLLRDASRKLKIGKHLVVHTKVELSESPGVYPLTPSKVEELVGKVGRWQHKSTYVQDGYALQIYKKLQGTKGIIGPRIKESKPRACVCRFGALGDAIILTPLLAKLKEEGYHVTFVGTPYCAPALENNPNIDNLILQEREAVPNMELGLFWKLWKPDYDLYINLSESLEGDLLIVEGRKEFFTSKEFRHSRCNKNYYDYTMERGGFKEEVGRKGELYFTEAEERRAKKFFEPLRGKWILLWALNGSSHHKVYPLMETVLKAFFKLHPDVVAITVGDETARLLEFDHPQLIEKAGKWSIRESLIATKYVDCVIGPETMITNAAGCFSTPKITLLSHSSHENLCKYWENDYCLEPDQSLAPCYPCHMLHYSKESCPTGIVQDTETGEEIGRAPICPISILPQKVLARIDEVYKRDK